MKKIQVVPRVALGLALAACLAAAPAARAGAEPSASADPVGAPRSLAEAIAMAESAHPSLRAARLDEQAALAHAEAADVLPDPRVTLGVFAEQVETRVGPQEATLSLAQTLPWFGKRALRRAAALGDAAVLSAQLEGTRLALRTRVTRAWVDLWFLESQRLLAAENVEILRRLEQIVRTRYKVASARHPDLLRLQLEIARLEDRLRRVEDMRPSAVARMNELLARPSDSPVPVPGSIPDSRLAADAERLLFESADSQPAVRALERAGEAAGLRAKLARRDAFPDLTFGVTYTSIGDASLPSVPGSGDDAWLASVSLNVPLWSRQRDAEVRRSISRRDALAAAASERSLSIRSDAARALFEHRDAERRVALYRDSLIPKINESLRAEVIAFSTGQADFLALLDAQRTLLELQLEQRRAEADVALSLARIDELAGTTLPRAEKEARR